MLLAVDVSALLLHVITSEREFLIHTVPNIRDRFQEA